MPMEKVSLTLIGGPTALLELEGLRLLTDPTFDEPGSYDSSGITLTKKTAPAISADAIGAIDVVLLSHDQHFDNLDRGGRAFLSRACQVLTTGAGAERLSGNSRGLAPWQSLDIGLPAGGVVRITATPARHGPVGFEPFSGDVIGFVLTPGEAKGPGIYISGDTVWYECVAEVARRFDIKLAILFTGAAEPRGPFHVTMDSNGAIEAAHAFANATIVAIHNEGWGHFTQSQDDLAHVFAMLGLASRFKELKRGVAQSLTL